MEGSTGALGAWAVVGAVVIPLAGFTLVMGLIGLTRHCGGPR
jgi:hypothetical protein